MVSIEKKVVTTILSMIRARREVTSLPESDVSARHPVARSSVRLREAQMSDFPAVAALKKRWGLAADSLPNWQRLWCRNPALAQMEFRPPIGWVLEAEGTPVGYLGNIPLLYRYGDRALTAVTGSSFVVESPYRAVSLSLIAAFYRQKPVDLYLTTTAIEAVGKIARQFKSDPLPQPDYDTMLFWVLQPYQFAQVVMKKLELAPVLSQMGSILTFLAVGADGIVHRRWPKASSNGFTMKEIGVHEIGDDFQALWAEKLKESPRLLADRSPAALRWHFDIPGDKGIARVICCYKNGELFGYAVIRSEPANEANGLRRSIVADMLARQDSPEILGALWAAAYDYAKHAGSHILEVLGFPHSVRGICSKWHPYLRKYPSCPFYYKAADPALHKMLSDGNAWYASAFDGDTTLWNFGTASQRAEA
jgi:hypothetical protein